MSVSITILDNGMTVVSEDMPHLRSAALGLWVDCGARDEAAHQHGISHLLEHMAFKGTHDRSARQIAEEIEAVGGELNASTSVETTGYYARVLSDHVGLGLDILSDILLNATFDPDELKREQMVILQEIGAAHDTPDDQVFDLFQETAYPEQPIGRPILGTRETVPSFSEADLRSYLLDNYAGERIVLAAAGRVNHDDLVRLAQERLQAFPTKSETQSPKAVYQGGEARLERDLQEVNILLGFEGCSYHSDDYFTAQILAATLGGGMSSRLFQEVREERGLCYAIYAFHWGYEDSGVFAIHAATGEETLDELFPVIIDQLKDMSEHVTDDEVDRAKAQIKASLLMAMESPAARAGQLARQLMVYGRARPPEELVTLIDAVTPASVAQLLKRMITHSMPTLASVGPISRVPSVEEIRSRLTS